MNRIKVISFFALLSLTAGCGRDECGYIKNETGKKITVSIRLQNIKEDPTKYLLDDALDGNPSDGAKHNGIDNYFISYDSLSNQLTFELDKDDELKLGTVRLDMTRDSIKYWEFDSISANGHGIKIHAGKKSIVNMVERSNNLFSQNSHYLILK